MLDMQSVPMDAPETQKGPMLPPDKRSAYRKYVPINNDRFVRWLRDECAARGVRNFVHLAERAKLAAEAEHARALAAGEEYDMEFISSSSLYNIEANKRRLADDGARAIARALDMTEEEEVVLFRMAGIMRKKGGRVAAPSVKQEAEALASKLAMLSENDREDMLSVLNTMVVLRLSKTG